MSVNLGYLWDGGEIEVWLCLSCGWSCSDGDTFVHDEEGCGDVAVRFRAVGDFR